MKEKGHSLIGAMSALVISGSIIFTAVPTLAALLEKNQKTQNINQMMGLLHYARSTAVLRRSTVTLCSGFEQCNETQRWRDHILIFIDHNHDGIRDDEDELVRQVTLTEGHSWRWSNFRQKTYSQFAENGRPRALNGTFSLCHKNSTTQQIVINVTGRVRTQSLQKSASCN